MKKIASWLMFFIIGILLVGCGGHMSKNSARLVELDASGQLMPGQEAIEGGCAIEAGNNVQVKSIKFKDGSCEVELVNPADVDEPPATE